MFVASFLLLSFSAPPTVGTNVSLRFEAGRHTAGVYAVASDPRNGDWVTVGADKAVRRWHEGRAMPPLRFATGNGSNGTFMCCAVSRTGLLAVGDADAVHPSIWLYDLNQGPAGAVVRIELDHRSDNDPQQFTCIGFSADGKLLAAGDNTGVLHVWNSADRKLVAALPLVVGGPVYALAFAPTGTEVAFAANGLRKAGDVAQAPSVGIVDASRRDGTVHRTVAVDRVVQCLDWSQPDSLVLGGTHAFVAKWRLGESTAKAFDPGLDAVDTVTSVARSTDGKTLAVGTAEGDVLLMDGTGERPRRLRPSGDRTVWSLSLNPDGRTLAVGQANGQVCEIDVATGTVARVLSGAVPRLSDLHWSGDGNALRWKADVGASGFDLLRSTPSASQTDATDEGRKLGEMSVRVEGRKVVIEGTPRWSRLSESATVLDALFLDENRLLVATTRGLHVYADDGRDAYRIGVDGGDPSCLARSPDGKRVAVGFSDGLVRIYAIPATGLALALPIASLYVGDGEWVAWQEATGLYDSSVNGDKIFGFQVNRKETELADFVPAETKEKEYRRPGLLSDLLAGTASSAPAANIAVAVKDVPVFKVLGVVEGHPTSDGGWEVPGERATVRVRLLNRKPGQKVTLRIGRGTPRDLPGLVDVEDDADETKCVVNGLVPGENLVSVYVDGQPVPGSEFPIKNLQPEPKAAERTFVLAIGIGKYGTPEMNQNSLPGPTLDSSAFVRVIKEGSLSDMPPQVMELPDDKANKEGILKGFAWLAENAKQTDRVLIFLASHGDQQGDATYITPYDYSLRDRAGTGIEWRKIGELLGRIDCKSIVLFTDSCHSGAAVNVAEENRVNQHTTLAMRSLRHQPALSVFAACADLEQSKEYPGVKDLEGHGLFTFALLQGLRGAIEDQRVSGGRVTDVDLRAALGRYMDDLSQKYKLDPQTPTASLPSAGVIPIARKPVGGGR